MDMKCIFLEGRVGISLRYSKKLRSLINQFSPLILLLRQVIKKNKEKAALLTRHILGYGNVQAGRWMTGIF